MSEIDISGAKRLKGKIIKLADGSMLTNLVLDNDEFEEFIMAALTNNIIDLRELQALRSKKYIPMITLDEQTRRQFQKYRINTKHLSASLDGVPISEIADAIALSNADEAPKGIMQKLYDELPLTTKEEVDNISTIIFEETKKGGDPQVHVQKFINKYNEKMERVQRLDLVDKTIYTMAQAVMMMATRIKKDEMEEHLVPFLKRLFAAIVCQSKGQMEGNNGGNV